MSHAYPARRWGERYNPACWLAWAAGYQDEHGHRLRPCTGELVRAHLIKQQVLLRELPAELSAQAVGDSRVMVLACGGPMGNAGHHGMFDHSRTLRVPWRRLPTGVFAMAQEYDPHTRTGHALTAWLEREYWRHG